MPHKFVKVGDVVKLKAGTKLWDKLSYDGRYMVMKTQPNPGYTDNTCFITKLEDGRSNIINLKINERYFDIIWKDEDHTIKSKFAVGDRVISIIDTPNIPEGFIGHIFSVDKGPRWDYIVQGIKDQAFEYFNEDELELLSVGKRETKFNPTLSEIENYNFPDTITPQDIAGVSKSALDKQVSGNHYKDCKIQPVEYIQANGLSYLEGNVIKYTTRHSKKNGKADIEKAIHYLELILEMEYKDKE